MESFGRYRLLKKIATGGMGEIWLARSASLDGFEKDLVIKRILPDLSSNEQFVSMFIDEARVSISMSHPNIVQVFDFGKSDDSYYIAMEFIHGADLTEVLSVPDFVGVGVPPQIAIYVMQEVLRGLDYAHNRKGRNGEPLGIIHRDISPDNVIISFDGAVKVTDFGIAKARGQVTELEEGMVVGKWSYMSPEQIAADPHDHRTDVFSCGIVLWELLTGEKLYPGELDDDLVEMIHSAQFDPPSVVRTALPDWVDDVVMGAMTRDPNERYPSARHFANVLHEALTQHYRDCDSFTLQAFLEERSVILDRGDFSTRVGSDAAPVTPTPDGVSSTMVSEESARTSVTAPPPFDIDPRVFEIAEQFKESPSMWKIVEIGDICKRAGHIDAAGAAYRLCAMKFAQHGLLAQAITCSRRLLDARENKELVGVVKSLPELAGMNDWAMVPRLFRTTGRVEELISELVLSRASGANRAADAPPLLASLGGDGLLKLVKEASVTRVEPEKYIVVQGDRGDTMFLILSGRAVVHAMKRDGARVYLASMSAGDFFGENSFFTGAPRTATVEATEVTEVIEIDRALYDRAMAENPEAESILLSFYKDRVVDSLLATSRVFSLLDASTRRDVIAMFTLESYEPGEVLIHEGDSSDEIYIIKTGAADAWAMDGDEKKVLSTVGAGTILGEIAALQGMLRTASVSARTQLEVLRLDSNDFRAILAAAPEVEEKILELAEKRESQLP